MSYLYRGETLEAPGTTPLATKSVAESALGGSRVSYRVVGPVLQRYQRRNLRPATGAFQGVWAECKWPRAGNSAEARKLR